MFCYLSANLHVFSAQLFHFFLFPMATRGKFCFINFWPAEISTVLVRNPSVHFAKHSGRYEYLRLKEDAHRVLLIYGIHNMLCLNRTALK